MDTSKKIEIPLSKTKLSLMLLASIVFFGTGIAMMLHPDKTNNSIFVYPAINFTFGIVTALFSGFLTIFLFKKLRDNSPGLIISDKGIVDNSSGVSAGFVPWTDITAIQESRVFNNRFINLIVKNPEKYISRQKNIFKRKLVQSNYNSFGAAISISENGLKSNYQELKVLLDNEFAEFNHNRS